MSHANCCVPGCATRGKLVPGLTFHMFPKDNDEYMIKIYHPEGRMEKVRRRKVWIDKLQVKGEVTNCRRVCGTHFTPNDFVPTFNRVRKAVHLKKNAVPSMNLPPINEEADSLDAEAIQETRLPDGTICEFFTTDSEEEDISGDADSPVSERQVWSDESNSSANVDSMPAAETASSANEKPKTQIRKKRKASQDPLARLDGLKTKKASLSVSFGGTPPKSVDIFDFDGIVEALEENRLKLPSKLWSYTKLDRSILIFLCWSLELKLKKKAVLRRGSQLELYCDGELITIDSSVDLHYYRDLELTLCLFDQYERCSGLGELRSPDCDRFIVFKNGSKAICNPCKLLNVAAPRVVISETTSSHLQHHWAQKRTALCRRLGDTESQEEVARLPQNAALSKEINSNSEVTEEVDQKKCKSMANLMKHVAKKTTGGRPRPKDSGVVKVEVVYDDDELCGDGNRKNLGVNNCDAYESEILIVTKDGKRRVYKPDEGSAALDEEHLEDSFQDEKLKLLFEFNNKSGTLEETNRNVKEKTDPTIVNRRVSAKETTADSK